MSGDGFSANWLMLREPYDAIAREAAGLTPMFAALLPETPHVLDLGCGTGANVRYLLLRLGRLQQRWTAIDHDPTLLARVPKAFPPFVQSVDARQHDLNDLDGIDFAGPDAVVTTALLDLCSEAWITRLADKLAAGRKPFLATVTVDGQVTFDPADPDDRFVLDLVDQHMLRDKGFGPALGPAAIDVTARLMRDRGYRVHVAPSDWDFRPEDGQMQHVMIHGYAIAAMEQDPDSDGRIAAWADRRHARVGTLQVGHVDLLAVPG